MNVASVSVVAEKGLPWDGPGGQAPVRVGDHDPAFQAGKGLHQAPGLLDAVVALAVVVIAVARHQHLGVDLAEAVEHPLEAEIRRGGGPHGAQRGGCQHGHHGLQDVGQIARHAVPGSDPGAPQGGLAATRERVQLTERHRAALTELVLLDNGEVFVLVPQELPGKVEPGPGEPDLTLQALGRGHGVVRQHRARRLPAGGVHPCRRPEILEPRHAPVVKRRKGVAGYVVGGAQPLPEPVQAGLPDPLLGG